MSIMPTSNKAQTVHHQRGFTLVELLLALALFAAAAALYYQHATQASSYFSQLRNQQSAAWLLQHHLAGHTASQAVATTERYYYHHAGGDWQLQITSQPIAVAGWQRLQYSVALRHQPQLPLATFYRYGPQP